MPIYSYKCKVCEESFEIVAAMKDFNKRKKCPNCGRLAYRDIVADHSSGVVDSQMMEYMMEGSTGCRMYAASYLPHQISEAKRVHPGREFKLVNNCYLPIIKNRTDRKKYLKEMNYAEYD